MTVVVAFGDSNTWGYEPGAGVRLAPETRWTGVMQLELGPAWRVIEEGLNGRTTVFDDPIEPDRRGADYLPPCLRSHAPLDLLIIALGCNDLKQRFSASAGDIANGAERLIQMARAEPVGPRGAPPAILLVAPPPLGRLSEFAEMFAGGDGEVEAAGGALSRRRRAQRRRFRRRRRIRRLLRPRRHPLRSRPARDPRPRHGGGGAHGPRLNAVDRSAPSAATAMTIPRPNHDRAAPLAGARNRRDVGAERADRARQPRRQPDDHDRRDDARLAFAPRARRRRARPSGVHDAAAVLHRRRRRARPARRQPGRRRPQGLRRPARRAASDAGERLPARCAGLARAVERRAHSAWRSANRRTLPPTRRATCTRCNGRLPPPCSISPRAARSPRSIASGRRWSPG